MTGEPSFSRVAVDLAFLVALRQRIRLWRGKGRRPTQRAFNQWCVRSGGRETADVLQAARRYVEGEFSLEDIRAPGFADEWEELLKQRLLSALVDARKRRGRPRKAMKSAGLIGSRLPPRGRGRQPQVPADIAQRWTKSVFMAKAGYLIGGERGTRDLHHALKMFRDKWFEPAEIDRRVSTAKAIEALIEGRRAISASDKRALEYVRRYYSRLRRRFPIPGIDSPSR